MALLASGHAATLFNGFGTQPWVNLGSWLVSPSAASGYLFQVGSHDLEVFRIWDMDTYVNVSANTPDVVTISDIHTNPVTSVSFTSYSPNAVDHGIYLGGSYLAAPVTLSAGQTYMIYAKANYPVRHYLDRPMDNYYYQMQDWSSSPYFQSPDVTFVSGYLATAFNPQTFNTAYTGIYFEYNVIPEPSTYALFGLGAAGLLLALGRRIGS